MKFTSRLTHPYYCIVILVLLLGSMSSCNRYKVWLTDVFKQTEYTAYSHLSNNYLRSLRLYDQLNTIGNFDALWIHQKVQDYAAKAYASIKGFDKISAEQYGIQQSQTQRKYISFYLLATTFNTVLLTDCLTQWSIQLLVDDKAYNPVSLQTVSIRPEYRILFGKYFNRFKQQYSLLFNAYDEYAQHIIKPTTTCIRLIFKRLAQKYSMVWKFNNHGAAIYYQEFNKDSIAYDINNTL